VFVCASLACFPDLPLREAAEKLGDLEFSSIEIDIHEQGGHLRPSEVAGNLSGAVDTCLSTNRLDVVAYSVDIDASGDDFDAHFTACCKLAKATKVVQITVPSGELGTPFNEEVERLRKQVAIAAVEGVRVSIRSQAGCLSEDPATAVVLCDNVPGLGVTLDPSAYIYGPHQGRSIEKLMKYTYHVHLRDTSKDAFQVRVGQGEVEYGKLVAALQKEKYNRALCVHISPSDDVDHMGELRKLRLLLESLL